MHRYFEIEEGGHSIRCKLYCRDRENIRRVILFGHGFGGHKDNSAAETFAGRLISGHEDCALLTFNWPAHGDDIKKELYLEDCSLYLRLLLAHVPRLFKTDEIYAYATSFGGYLTLKYISEHGNPFRKIALRCPAVNMYDVLSSAIMSADELDRLQKGNTVPVGFDRKIMIGPPLMEGLMNNDIQHRDFTEHAEKILILHGASDEIVPFEAARRFSEKNLIEFVPIDGADHRFQDADKMELAIRLILKFFDL